jgi:glutaconate CoA-transferase subunit A
LKSKIVTIGEAADYIKDGSRIIIGGSNLRSHPMAMIRELIRRGIKNLVVEGYSHGIDVDMLVGAHCIKTISASYIGFESLGLAPNFRKGVEKGEVEIIDYPELMERFYAGAYGMPFYPTRDLFGTDILKYNKEIKEGVSPITGEKFSALPPAHADIAIIHAGMSDEYGNVLYKPHRLMTADEDIWFSKCADKVIVTVEKIIDNKYVRRNPHMNQIPEYRTSAVVPLHFGAHPCAYDYFYDYDREHLKLYLESSKTEDGYREYLQKYVYGVDSHEKYLDLVGPTARLLNLTKTEGFFL